MMWEEILKANPPNPRNPHGIHVTKMYMFLKRYFADSHTEQFKKTYILWHQFDYPSDRDRVHEAITNIIDGTYVWHPYGATTSDKPIPGITIRSFDKDDDNPDIEFNDAEHIKGRDEHIANSLESNLDKQPHLFRHAYKYKNTYAQHDFKLQRGWEILERSIKKTHNPNHSRPKINWRY